MEINKRVGIDIDGVITNVLAGVRNYAMQHWGTIIDPETVSRYNLVGCTGITEEQIGVMFDDAEFYRRLEILPEAGDALRRLRHYDIHLVTARPVKLWNVTHEWLLGHAVPYLAVSHQPSKVAYAVRMGIKVFVEDKREAAIELAEVCREVYLVDWPYNRGKLPNNVIRVASLWAAVDRIKRNHEKR